MNREKCDNDVVRRYPNAGLTEQVREYEDTFSVAELLKETFFEKKT